MGIHVVNFLRRDIGVVHRVLHASCRTIPTGSGLSHMMSIPAHAESAKLRVNPRASRLCVIQRFQHQNASTFPHNETIAPAIPGATGLIRRLIAST